MFCLIQDSRSTFNTLAATKLLLLPLKNVCPRTKFLNICFEILAERTGQKACSINLKVVIGADGFILGKWKHFHVVYGQYGLHNWLHRGYCHSRRHQSRRQKLMPIWRSTENQSCLARTFKLTSDPILSQLVVEDNTGHVERSPLNHNL